MVQGFANAWPRKDCYNNYLLLIGNSEHLFELAQARLQQGLRLCIIDVAGRENRVDACLIEMKGLTSLKFAARELDIALPLYYALLSRGQLKLTAFVEQCWFQEIPFVVLLLLTKEPVAYETFFNSATNKINKIYSTSH